MPTATSTLGFSLSNLGPLTTTYTAPASCATLADAVLIAPATQTDDLEWSNNCGFRSWGDCFPSGSAIGSAISTVDISNPANGFSVFYFSPGLICPTGWTTAGVATKAKGGSITSSGPAFVLPTTTTLDPNPEFFNNLAPNVLLGALDEEETAVLCCPSAMTADVGGYCSSVISSFTPTSGCARLLPSDDVTWVSSELSIFGTTVTAEMASFVHTSPITSTRHTTFAASEASEWIGVSQGPMVMLVHREADLAATATATTTATTTPTSSPNAAVSPRARTTSSGLGLPFLWCVIAVALGSSLILVM